MRHETAAGSMPVGGTPSASNPWKCKALHIQSDCGSHLLWRPDTSDTLPSPHQRQSGGPASQTYDRLHRPARRYLLPGIPSDPESRPCLCNGLPAASHPEKCRRINATAPGEKSDRLYHPAHEWEFRRSCGQGPSSPFCASREQSRGVFILPVLQIKQLAGSVNVLWDHVTGSGAGGLIKHHVLHSAPSSR